MSEGLRRRLYKQYWALEQRLAPGLKSNYMYYRDRLVPLLASRPRWLDLGCGHQYLPTWAWKPGDLARVGEARLRVGVDMDLASLKAHPHLDWRCIADAHRLPFAEASFDLVTATFVVEHLKDPPRALEEIARMLAPGGAFLFLTPNRRHPAVALASRTPDSVKRRVVALLENRAESDIFPTYYRLNTREAVVQAAARAGFEVEECALVMSNATTGQLGPAALPELLCIRLLMREDWADYRTNLIGVLRKRGS